MILTLKKNLLICLLMNEYEYDHDNEYVITHYLILLVSIFRYFFIIKLFK